jgi:biotin carboxyl carrier protein
MRLKKGDKILVLEAMKMENVIKSPTEGIIKTINVKQSQAVEKNQVLITFK